jgi:uncharacterized protein with ParB-like and HNH nuclease domain
MTSYGIDLTLDGIVKRMQVDERGGKGIKVPDFQRSFVWDHKRSIRFIESLLLNMPVPGIFLSLEPDNSFLVVDGQQRLKTIQFFYEGKFDDGKPFVLHGVNSDLEGKTYTDLDETNKNKLDNTVIHATVIKQNKRAGEENLYRIFDRLNSGGMQLTPHEIRNAASYGVFHKLLIKLNANEQWRAIFGPKNTRDKDQELILRFFALYFDSGKYRSPMKGFLDNFMRANRQLTVINQDEKALTQLFESTIEIISRCIGKDAFRLNTALNAAVFDAVMVGVARRLERGAITDCESFKEKYTKLISEEGFRKAVSNRTANNEFVRDRIKLATDTFANII